MAFAALEMLRFQAVVAFVPGLTGPGEGFFQAALSANILFGCAFFFMWLDRERYTSFRYLVAAGKAVSCVFLVKALVAGLSGAAMAGGAIVPAVVLLYDALAALWAAFLIRVADREKPHAAPPKELRTGAPVAPVAPRTGDIPQDGGAAAMIESIDPE